MRALFYIALLCIVTACKDAGSGKPAVAGKPVAAETRKPGTADSVRKYFRDSIAQATYQFNGKGPLFGTNASNADDPLIFAFEEEYVDTTRIEAHKKWLRITVRPCFRIPYCIVLELIDTASVLTLKMTDGRGCNSPGYLDFVSSQKFSDSLYSGVSKRLHGFGFWQLGQDTSCHGGMDGEVWTIEAIENRRYNLVGRWAPLHCGNTTTKELASLVVELRKMARLKQYLKARTGMPEAETDEWYPDK